MTFNKLASEIARREGKKSQVAIGNIREILKILETILAEECLEYWKNGKMPAINSAINDRVIKRAKALERKAKKAKKK